MPVYYRTAQPLTMPSPRRHFPLEQQPAGGKDYVLLVTDGDYSSYRFCTRRRELIEVEAVSIEHARARARELGFTPLSFAVEASSYPDPALTAADIDEALAAMCNGRDLSSQR